MINLRKLAEGKPCQIRIPGICNNDTRTTVLAHVRMAGLAGIGQKPNDLIGAWACHTCHGVVDGRIKTEFTYGERRLMHLEGMARTINELVKLHLLEGIE